jgi:hypothetical protein
MHKVSCLLQYVRIDCLWGGLDLNLDSRNDSKQTRPLYANMILKA